MAVLLPLHSFHALANKPEADVIVHVTETRTVTVCPITEWFTCEADLPTSTTKHDDTPATTTPSGGNGGWGSSSPTASSSGGDGGWGSSTHTGGWGTSSGVSTTGGHGGDGGWGSSSTSAGTTTGDHEHHGSSSTTAGQPGTTTSHHDGSDSTTTSHHDGSDGTTTSHSVPTGTTSSYSTSVSGTTSTSTTTSGTTTSSSCGPTATKLGIEIPTTCLDNTPSDRSRWCGKSVDDDTHTTFQTGKTKKYTLTITKENLDFDGSLKESFAINGKTPGEPIVANWGDIVEVTVVNGLSDNATTIHWHGIRQIGTNDQDGVPGVTECGIPPNGARTYTWHASTYGTGWYHSHTLAQYGGGIRGPIIIHGPATAEYDYDLGTVMIDEKFTQTIFQMAYNIARVRGALPAAANYLLNGKNKSPDGSTGESSRWVVKKGKKHLFRIINR